MHTNPMRLYGVNFKSYLLCSHIQSLALERGHVFCVVRRHKCTHKHTPVHTLSALSKKYQIRRPTPRIATTIMHQTRPNAHTPHTLLEICYSQLFSSFSLFCFSKLRRKRKIRRKKNILLLNTHLMRIVETILDGHKKDRIPCDIYGIQILLACVSQVQRQ